ncbi:hypothetical protein KXS11_10960 [Plantibacter flavus]|uniref:FMN-binding protein n=1 Tax=Plantibacter flavus TaxID=150123 RepID=UPI003F16D0A2
MPHNLRTRATLGLGAFTLSATLAACAAQAQTPASSAVDSREPSPTAAATPAPDAAGAYADGTYSATGWYGSLPSHHDVTLTVDEDIVTEVQITTPAEDEASLGYQQRFAEALPGTVIGRNLDEIAVDRLAGSSGCSEGFMNALAQIKEQAAA